MSTSQEYGQWARDQRPQGTVYGGPGSAGPGNMTMAMAGGLSVENSGSLTGHILAQGRSDDPTPPGNTARVLLIMALVLGILIAVGVLAVFAAGDTFSNLFDGLLNG